MIHAVVLKPQELNDGTLISSAKPFAIHRNNFKGSELSRISDITVQPDFPKLFRNIVCMAEVSFKVTKIYVVYLEPFEEEIPEDHVSEEKTNEEKKLRNMNILILNDRYEESKSTNLDLGVSIEMVSKEDKLFQVKLTKKS